MATSTTVEAAMKSRKSKEPWELDPADVSFGGSASTSTHCSGNYSRKLKTSSVFRTATHRPTGISVEGSVPRGHYSKKEMREEERKLHARMLSQLELLVATALRIPGR